MKKLVLLVGGLLLIPATAVWAAGGSSLTSGYNGSGGAELGLVQKSNGSLPFTGFSLTAVVVAGILLVAIGLLMRRARATN
jgi:hypothetical protein